MRKAKFIINPSSGRQNILGNIESIIGGLILNQIVNHVDVAYTNKENDATLEAMKMHPGEYDFVVAVGGDGTVHDVINGVISGGNHTPVAVISSGTANSFANLLDLVSDRNAFCRMIKNFNTMEIDVGKINDRFFVNSAAGGLWANTGFTTPKESKAVLGRMAYYIEGARELPKHMFKTVRLKFESESFCGEKDVLLFVIRNAGNMTGNKDVDTRQILTDGYLDVLIVEKMGLMKLPGLFFKFMQGEHLNQPGMIYFKTKSLDIINKDKDASLIVDFDGERFGELPIHVEAVQKAVRIIVP